MKIAVIGATSKTGRYVVRALCERGHEVVAVGRDADRLAQLDARAGRTRADVTDTDALSAVLDGAEIVASLAHARHTGAVLAALPASCRRVVLTGSLRKHTRLPDPAADAVRQGEALFLASGRPGVMLHPSMIYGAPEERNVNRILAYIAWFPRWLPVPVPLPDGGRHTVQPIFVDDMVAAMVAAIESTAAGSALIAVAGPHPITYREMVETCAAALGRRAVVIPVPLRLIAGAVTALGQIGIRPPIDALELARATESKAFEINELRETLGIVPRGFAEGVATALARRSRPAAVDGRAPPD